VDTFCSARSNLKGMLTQETGLIPLALVMKICRKCWEVKKLGEFQVCRANSDGKQRICRVCLNKWSKEWRQKPEIKLLIKVWQDEYNETLEAKIRQKEYRQRPEVKARLKIYNKEYRQIPEAKIRAKELEKERYDNDRNFKIAKILRSRLYSAVKDGQKAGSAVDDLGCSIEFLRAYLESHFSPGMTWANWGTGPGKWNIDHIVPLAWFDLTNREQLLSACHYTNLQPLWSEENLSKSDRYQQNPRFCRDSPVAQVVFLL